MLKRGWGLALVAGALLTGLSGPVWAQGQTSGSIRGQVIAETGEPVANVQVIVENAETGLTRGVLSSADGRYAILLLPPGTYTVRAQSVGFAEQVVRDVRVRINEATVVPLNLATQAVAIEGVTVRADRSLQVDPRDGGVTEYVVEEQINNLPTAGRDFTDFINLSGLISPQPGIGTGGQFSIAGARTTGTNLQIDGADANNAFFGENRGSSRLPFAFSLESIREFQIITNGYDVEHGRFSGGLINVVTKSGTNETKGSIFAYGRDDALTSDNFDDTQLDEFSSYQFGGVLSGPILKDELFYLVSGDFQLRNTPVFALVPERANIPAADIDEFLDILSGFGVDPASQQGVFEETEDQAALFGRLDWNIDDNHRATLRANYTNFQNENDRISRGGTEALSLGGSFQDNALSVVGELNSILNETGSLYNVLRLHYADEARPRPANSRLPTARVDVEDGQLRFGGNFFGILFDNNLEETKFQLTNNLTWQRGDHTFKFGTDNILTHTFNKFFLNGNGFFDFDSLEDFRENDPSFFLRFVPALPGTRQPDPNPTAPIAEFDTYEFSLYAQDEWQTTDKLLLSLGVRYDRTVFPDEGQPLSNPEFQNILQSTFGVSPTSVPADNNNFGPRAAFTYDFTGEETSILRGGTGLFYGRIPAVLHGNVLSTTPNPLLAVVCIGAATPDFDFGNPDPSAIPTNCAPDFQSPTGFKFGRNPFGIGIVGAPEIAVWDEDAQLPTTWKANLGYEQLVTPRVRAGIQALFSQTWNNYVVKDLNIQDPVFLLDTGRPVHTAVDDFDPTDAASERDYGVTSALRRVYFQTDGGEARAFNIKLDFDARPTDDIIVGANYAYNRAFDNSSFVCCTANAGLFDIPTFGNPNFLGEIGDDEVGTWGPSDFEQRHVFVTNAVWQLPAGFDLGVIYRAQSGNPFTPDVDGDVNADGDDGNDRPFIPDPDNPTGVQFGRLSRGNLIEGSAAEELAEYRAILAQNECLREEVGEIISRNTCRNPWFHSVDVKATKEINTFGDNNLAVTLDLFNVLDGLGLDAGEWVFKRSTLFRAEGFDESTQEVVYSVNNRYGQEIPIGIFQFQAQLGLRYSF